MSTNPYVPVFYYSNRCDICKEIIQTLQSLNKASLYRFVCIDTTPRHLIPAEVRAVPTVFNPQTKEVVTGKNAIFAQVAKPVQSRRELPTDARAPSGPAEPGAWSFMNTGFSEPYTIFDTATKMPDDQLFFSYLGQTESASGMPEGPQRGDLMRAENTSKTGKNDDIASRMEAMATQRDAEFQGVARK